MIAVLTAVLSPEFAIEGTSLASLLGLSISQLYLPKIQMVLFKATKFQVKTQYLIYCMGCSYVQLFLQLLTTIIEQLYLPYKFFILFLGCLLLNCANYDLSLQFSQQFLFISFFQNNKQKRTCMIKKISFIVPHGKVLKQQKNIIPDNTVSRWASSGLSEYRRKALCVDVSLYAQVLDYIQGLEVSNQCRSYCKRILKELHVHISFQVIKPMYFSV